MVKYTKEQSKSNMTSLRYLLMSAIFKIYLSYFLAILGKFKWFLVFYLISPIFMLRKLKFDDNDDDDDDLLLWYGWPTKGV